jgi:hypothetical protein
LHHLWLSAQEVSGRSDQSYDREVGLTYSFLRDVGENGTTGFLVDVGRRMSSKASIVGEFAVNHFGSMEETYVQGAGGVRVGGVAGTKTRPFAQFLVGMQHEFGSTGLVMQPGVGINIGVGRRADVRVQGDFPIVRWEGETYKQFRFGAGIGLALGGR